jgi:NADH dehydrogenase/NADH:ubiquinone oxidoreductase subunit G
MDNITITIDGSQVNGKEGMTVLEIAQENGIDIPTLCYHQSLVPVGASRPCKGWKAFLLGGKDMFTMSW